MGGTVTDRQSDSLLQNRSQDMALHRHWQTYGESCRHDPQGLTAIHSRLAEVGASEVLYV